MGVHKKELGDHDGERLVRFVSSLLGKLRRTARNVVARRIASAVITVPAYFNDSQKQAIRMAVYLSGLNVQKLTSEPIAAALAFELNLRETKGVLAVYDLGGGTFDVSVIEITGRDQWVLAIGGDSNLGGDDFTALVLEYLLGSTNDTGSFLESEKLSAFHRKAKVCKESLGTFWEQNSFSLSGNPVVSCWVGVSSLTGILGLLLGVTVTMLSNTITLLGMKGSTISLALLVGGSAQIGILQGLLQEQRYNIMRLKNPELMVSVGAAIAAYLLGQRESVLSDILPFDIGLEVWGEETEVILAKHSRLPTSVVRELTTLAENQTSVLLKVVQGNSRCLVECQLMVRCVLHVPPMPAGLSIITASLSVTTKGLLVVRLAEKYSNVSKTVNFLNLAD